MIYLLYGFILGLAVTVQPGPFLAFIISQTLRNGWRRTLPAVFAPLLTDGPIAVLAILVLSHFSSEWIQWLRIAGGLFILYLAWSAYRSWKNYSAPLILTDPAGKKSLLQAAVVNLLNPGPYLGWSLVMGPLLLKGWHESFLNGILLITGFYGIMIVTLTLVILVFHFAGNIGIRLNRVLIGITALALAAFGLFQFWAGIKVLVSGH
jgi:threonine/homoserine/homoserine lactone efflux protein